MTSETWVMVNWEECGFKAQPYILRYEFTHVHTAYYTSKYGTLYTTLHSSLNAAKQDFRKEHSVKGKTPRFKWEKQ